MSSKKLVYAEDVKDLINGLEELPWEENVDDLVDSLPTVDAVEVVHGRWVLLAEFSDGSICTECPVCGEEYTYKKGRLEHIGVEYAKYNYCPNCGAKMDGDKNAT